MANVGILGVFEIFFFTWTGQIHSWKEGLGVKAQSSGEMGVFWITYPYMLSHPSVKVYQKLSRGRGECRDRGIILQSFELISVFETCSR